MNRKFLLAISLASVLAAPATAVYAEGEDEKKPEQPQFLAEGEDEKKAGLIIVSESDDSPRPIDRTDVIILSEGDDSPRPIERPDLIVLG